MIAELTTLQFAFKNMVYGTSISVNVHSFTCIVLIYLFVCVCWNVQWWILCFIMPMVVSIVALAKRLLSYPLPAKFHAISELPTTYGGLYAICSATIHAASTQTRPHIRRLLSHQEQVPLMPHNNGISKRALSIVNKADVIQFREI